jgi:hypothetical protein
MRIAMGLEALRQNLAIVTQVLRTDQVQILPKATALA